MDTFRLFLWSLNLNKQEKSHKKKKKKTNDVRRRIIN